MTSYKLTAKTAYRKGVPFLLLNVFWAGFGVYIFRNVNPKKISVSAFIAEKLTGGAFERYNLKCENGLY